MQENEPLTAVHIRADYSRRRPLVGFQTPTDLYIRLRAAMLALARYIVWVDE
jgi:hypothetical protein